MGKLHDLLYAIIDRVNKSVKTTVQSLSESEKTQARANIGAMPSTYVPPNQTAQQVGADPKGTAAAAVSAHNTNTAAHADIRNLITGLADRLNALANSDDTTLDQMKEVVDYIQDNRELIESVTTNKVNVADIVDNLATADAKKPLSAKQGVELLNLINSSSGSGGGSGVNLDSAEVGQLIVVESVDADGKPVKWKAVDRTHYKETIGEDAEVISQRYIDFTGSTATLTGLGANIFQDGHTYKVNWNGTEYPCKAYLSDGIVHLGNGSLAGAPVATAEPFCIVGAGITCMVFKDTETAQSVKFKVDSVAEVVYHQIDPKYIKDMYYTEGGREEILPECQPVLNSDDGGFIIESGAPDLEIGAKYTVNWNGTEYTSVALDGTALGETGTVVLGDVYTASGGNVGTTATGEPYIIISLTGAGQLIAMPIDGATELTLSIYQDGEIVHKLNNKYLNLDWLPIYKEESVKIFEDAVHLSTAKLKLYDVPPFSIVVGKKYSVVWNDKVYEVTAKRQDASYDGNLVICTHLGNTSLTNVSYDEFDKEDTGEDFCILMSSLTGFRIYGTDKDSDNTITVAEYALVPNTLPKEYLPDGVPYCIDGGKVEIMPETTIAGDDIDGDGTPDSSELPITQPLNLVVGSTYIVNWNGTEHTCVAESFDMEGMTLKAMGNLPMMEGSGDSGHPFLILEVPAELVAEIGIYGQAMDTGGATSATFSIYQVGAEVRKLDNRCLDMDYLGAVLGSSAVTLNLVELGMGTASYGAPAQLQQGLRDYVGKIVGGAKVRLIFKYNIGNSEETYDGYVTDWKIDAKWYSAVARIPLGTMSGYFYFTTIYMDTETNYTAVSIQRVAESAT